MQDCYYKYKKCWYKVLDLRQDGIGNMIDHLKKHLVYQSPLSASSQQTTIDEMFQLNTIQTLAPMMSLEQAILEWIVDTLQLFIVVERPSF